MVTFVIAPSSSFQNAVTRAETMLRVNSTPPSTPVSVSGSSAGSGW